MHKSVWRHCAERVCDLHYKSAVKSSTNVLKKDIYNQTISCCCGNRDKSGIPPSAFIKSLTLEMKTKRTNLQKGPPAPRSCWERCCWWRGQRCSRDSGRPASDPGCSLPNKDKVQRSAGGGEIDRPCGSQPVLTWIWQPVLDGFRDLHRDPAPLWLQLNSAGVDIALGGGAVFIGPQHLSDTDMGQCEGDETQPGFHRGIPGRSPLSAPRLALLGWALGRSETRPWPGCCCSGPLHWHQSEPFCSGGWGRLTAPHLHGKRVQRVTSDPTASAEVSDNVVFKVLVKTAWCCIVSDVITTDERLGTK